MSDKPEFRILPTNSGTPSSYGVPFHLNTSNLFGYDLPETSVSSSDKPQPKILVSNVVDEDVADNLLLIGRVTPAEIKIAYESNPDTNAYTDSDRAIVLGIEGKLQDEIDDRTAIDSNTLDLINAEVIARVVADNNIYTTISGVQILIPTALSQLSDDATHRLITDTERDLWDAKLDGDSVIDCGQF